MSQSFSLAFPYPPSPVTGSPLFFSSASIIFHRPTKISMSIGVTRRLYTLTFGRLSSSRSSREAISSRTLRDFVSRERCERMWLAVRRGASFASGMWWPVSW